MDSREYYHAMVAKRDQMRNKSREAYEVARFQEFLAQLVNPYIKNKPKKAEDVIKFQWELEAKMPIEELKQVLKTIASTNFGGGKKERIRTSPPVAGVKKMKRTKHKR